MATGKEIKRLREGNASAAKVAGLIGVNVDKLRKWEERDTDPSDTGDIEKVEAYFGCKLGELHNLKQFDFVKIPATSKHEKSPDTMPELVKELLESQRARIKLLEERQQAETRLIQVEATLKIVVEILHGLKIPEHARTPSADESTVEVAYRAKNVNKNESTGQKADRK